MACWWAFKGYILAYSHPVLHCLICQYVRSGHFKLLLLWMTQPWSPHLLGHDRLMSSKTMSPKEILCSAVSVGSFTTREQVANIPRLHAEPQGQARRLRGRFTSALTGPPAPVSQGYAGAATCTPLQADGLSGHLAQLPASCESGRSG